MHNILAQRLVEIDHEVDLVCSGSDLHVAITTSITISITFEHGCSYRDKDREDTKLCGPRHTLDRAGTNSNLDHVTRCSVAP